MKILLINKFHYRRGGSETYYLGQIEALKALGHEVICFAMQDDHNLPCDQAEYFVSNVDYNNGDLKSKILSVKSFFYSKEAEEKMKRLIEKEHPDIAHIGLLHRQITFSVVEVLKKYHIPVVMTMHDLIFSCPNYTMLCKGKICEKCVKGSSLNCVKNKCVKGSFSKSMLAAAEKVYLKKKHYYDDIDLYITECDLYRNLMKLSRITKSRIITMTNFLPMEQEYGYKKEHENYILYFGRFSEEKGIITLLKAHQNLDCRYKLIIVGAGPQKNQITDFINMHGLKNVELPGPIYGSEMERIIEKSKMVIVPSEWYENCPYALLQALAKGKIVIASRIGGLPELIEDKKTGFLFTAGDETELSKSIDHVMNMSEEDYDVMSEEISRKAFERHNWKSYFDVLIREYENLIKQKKENS